MKRSTVNLAITADTNSSGECVQSWRGESRFYFFLKNPMKVWIAKLFGSLKDEAPPVVKTLRCDGLRADVFASRPCCGYSGYVLEFHKWDERDDAWQLIAVIFDRDVPVAISLLEEFQEVLAKNMDGKVKELPKVHVGGKTYFVDERLAQLRNVDDPHDFIGFTLFA